MARIILIDPTRPDAIIDILGALDKPEGMLRKIGAFMVSASNRSFDEQRLGTIDWSPRYPSQVSYKLNVAGIVSDFTRGKTPPARRFVDRPAAVDTRVMRNSVSSTHNGRDRVETGTTLPYAPIQFHGGVSVQPVTDTTKANMIKWLLKGRRSRKAAPVTVPRTMKEYHKVSREIMSAGNPYAPKLIGILRPNVRTHDTEVISRPFIGITDQVEREIISAVEGVIPGRGLGAAGGVS